MSKKYINLISREQTHKIFQLQFGPVRQIIWIFSHLISQPVLRPEEHPGGEVLANFFQLSFKSWTSCLSSGWRPIRKSIAQGSLEAPFVPWMNITLFEG